MTHMSPAPKTSTFRRMAAAMWRRPRDPTIYGSLDIDATAALAFLERHQREAGVKITVSHLVASAVARMIARHPEVNAKVRFWGRIDRRDDVVLTLQVASDDGRDLSVARIEAADHKSVADIAEEVRAQARSIRLGKDENYDKTRSLVGRLPWWLVRPALDLGDLITNELELDLPRQGLMRDPFGSAMVTNVGMFGIDTAFAPFTPIARCPILVLVPEVRRRPWVEDDAIVVRPVLRLCATFDHRIIDGAQAGALSRTIRALLEAPEQLAMRA
jgi:pyruvate/2-oxoglutarate dehydrogenase complex dihydrolipoamide acyltransferase (E2) component